MGRLEDIAARNRNPKRSEKMSVGIGLALFLLLILALVLFTDLGVPNDDAPDPPRPGEQRVNDVKLR